MNELKQATLYRMVMPEHTCPYGLKSLDLLKRAGYEVDDHHLTDRAQIDAFKKAHGVETTPQTFVDGRRVGGHSEFWIAQTELQAAISGTGSNSLQMRSAAPAAAAGAGH
ncbi:glutaredoxin family protein [Oxalicibacterium faecigallinarum]|uniref:Glutaredoxin domain-containing protein n=1 Tax=Oxalicibacterium faecigallinarum TaxID=573741 RepID=A0A8J3ALP1_9BURK|nr:glutaredoxin [Oxalicibacterium faecigallinarum]GGI16947.1 hypothetical protein GCM10008066_06510 [Oxalicibacterium faecigallinarum]